MRLKYHMEEGKDVFSTYVITRDNYRRVAEYLEKEGADVRTILNYVKTFSHFFHTTDMDIDLEKEDADEH